MIKYTYEEVKYYIEVESNSGCKLLSTKYMDARSKLIIQCNCNNKFDTTFSRFKNNNKRQCNECGRRIQSEKRRKTTEQFKEEVNFLTNGEYEVLSEYKKASEKIMFIHNSEKCNNHVFWMVPNAFLNGQRCPKCYGNPLKTTEEYIKEVYDLVGNEYTIVGKYKNSNTKIKIRHNICNRNYKVLPNNFLNGQRCPNCANKEIRNIDEFIIAIEKIDKNYTVLSTKYKDLKSKISMRHNICECEWELTARSLLNNLKCPVCDGNTNNVTTDIFKKKIYKLFGDEYEVVGEYSLSTEPVAIRHTTCNNTYNVVANNILSGNRCPFCNVNAKKTQERFEEEVDALTSGEFKVMGKYKGSHSKIKMFHVGCSKSFYTTPTSFLHRQSCVYCSKSKGEQKIERYLISNNIKYKMEYEFDDLLSPKGNPLRFDFAIFDKPSHNLMWLIEYDGEFHFKKYYDEQNFEIQQIHDELKNQYCTDNSIPLLRIPYWEFDNIETILDNQNIKLERLNGV